MTSDDSFERSREQAGELLAAGDVDGLYVAVTRGDEMDFAFAHRFDDPEVVGMRALSLLAKHVQVVAEEAELPADRVAEDAALLAEQLGEGRPSTE